MRDDRNSAHRILGRLELKLTRTVWLVLLMPLLAGAVAWFPEHAGLTAPGKSALFILTLAAGLWVTEAIPAFAVAILILSLEIALLGRPGSDTATNGSEWVQFVSPWSSPIIWLFLGGFVMAAAAAKTGLDRWFSLIVLKRCGTRPAGILLGIMAVTFCFSMFISNTATTAMMIAATTPIIASLTISNPFRKALLLAIPFAANVGGMGTVIGSPPNAIAIGSLQASHPLTFFDWMFFGLPPALILFGVVYTFLLLRYPSSSNALPLESFARPKTDAPHTPLWQKILVMITFFTTVGLWLSEPIHGIPSPVISFSPLLVFTLFQVVDAEDIRQLPWDVLLLVTGGLSLGVAVAQTGLATWLVEQLSLAGQNLLVTAIGLAFACSLLSNFMSNTAAANILIPIGIAIGAGSEQELVVPIALAASAAMCLPVSTPPNAIAFSQGQLATRDFLLGGLIVGILAPVLCTFWCRWVAG